MLFRSCAGPLDVGKASECRFCGTPINDGSTDWVLEDVQPFSAMRAYLQEQAQDQRIVAAGGHERMETDRFLNEPDLLVAVARMAMSDGVLHDRERQMLIHLAQSRGVGPNRLEQIVNTSMDPSQPVNLPRGEEQAQAFMVQLIRAALIDGMISREERKLLVGVGSQVGWTAREISRSIKATRKDLYGEAKDVLDRAEHMPPPPSPGQRPSGPGQPPPPPA